MRDGLNASSSTLGIQYVARLLSAAGTSQDAMLVKASPGRVYKILGQNTKASVVYLKLYDKATAPASTDTPKLTIPLAASSAINVDFTAIGVSFNAGIGFRLTTDSPDNSVNGLTAADVVGLNVIYE